MKLTRVPLAATALVLAACASKPADPAQTEAEAARAEALAQMTLEEKVELYNAGVENEMDKLVCRKERPLGSHFPRTRCYTKQEIEEMRRAAQDQLGRPKVRQGIPGG